MTGIDLIFNETSQYQASKGKMGGQNKFPRVLKKEQLSDWRAFLEEQLTI